MAKDTQPLAFNSFTHSSSAELLIVLTVVLHSDIQAASFFTKDAKVTHPVHSAVLFHKNSGAFNEMTGRST